MKQWWNYTRIQEFYQAHKQLNGLFYYLRRIPLIGKAIPERIYSAYDVKSIFFILYTIFFFPFRFLMKGLWLGLYVVIARVATNLLANKELFAPFAHQEELGLLLWLIIVAWSVHFLSHFGYHIDKAERDFIQYFTLSRTEFLETKLYATPIVQSLYYLPPLLLLSFLSKNPWILIVGIIALLASRFTAASLTRYLYEKQWPKKRVEGLVWINLIGSILLLPAVVFVNQWVRTPLLIGICLLQGVLLVMSLIYLRSYKNKETFYAFSMEKSSETDQVVEGIKSGSEYTRQGVDMQKKLTLDDQKDLSHLTGMAYLNALLFQRYRSILWKRQRNWLIGFAVASLVGLGGSFYYKEFLPEKLLMDLLPLTFTLMYFCSMGRPIAQMVFVNCDIAMLHYPFYREPRTILDGFRFRFFKTFQYNLSLAAAIFFMCWIWGGFAYSWQFLLLFALLLVSLTALFSFHDLFIYYLLQPFTKDMEVVNPIYRFLSGALYWVAYLNLQMNLSGPIYLLSVSLVLLAYVAIGYLILLKKAPKTFVLK
ncbi:hypothetical protein ACVR1I_00510 [Streptococcus cameli]